ncbi:MAG: hypothetical protein J07HN4v3_01556 [Halonotius sp. J07HN4]|nr:MAG: hypothetical protein J07HN4v3_01556 [Halonotius sp. J07HN4]
MAEITPTCPDDWALSTTLPTHLSLHYRGDGRSLLVCPTEPAPTATDPETVGAWTVKGLAGYGPTYPIFAEAVDRAEAIATAETVMAAITAGDDPSPVRISDRRGAGLSTSAVSEPDNLSDDTDEQAALTAFAERDTE